MRNLDRPSRKKPIIKILVFAFFLLFLLVGAIKLFNLEELFFRGPSTVVDLITDSGLENDRDRINVLLLGIGGAGHEGPNLSDTIIFASIDKNGKDVALVSIPRDLWSPLTSAKINSVYAFGEEKNGEGLQEIKKAASHLFDVPIHYAIRIDFDGFVKAVNLVDGVDVEVETAFDDSRYPIAGREDDLCGLTIETVEMDGVSQQVVKDATGSATPLSEINDQNDPFVCRYETISFNQGLVHMDGKTALKFVRSRHGTNNQGSDFARSARQQKVILAFRQKVLSAETLLNPKTALDLARTFGESIDTDITDEEVPYFAKLAQKIDPGKIRRVVLDSGRDESVLAIGDPQFHGGQFVLVPKSNSWRDLAEYIQGEIFKLEER